MYLVLFLLCVCGLPQDHSRLTVDGYIEINHMWSEENGTLIFDQVLVWAYNPNTGKYDCLHWDMIKDGRESQQYNFYHYHDEFTRLLRFIPDGVWKKAILWQTASQAANDKKAEVQHLVALQRTLMQLQHAKDFGVKPDEVVVYVAEPWLGTRSITFNQNTGKYELSLSINGDERIIFSLSTLVETNTLSDPEQDYKRFVREGAQTKMQTIRGKNNNTRGW